MVHSRPAYISLGTRLLLCGMHPQRTEQFRQSQLNVTPQSMEVLVHVGQDTEADPGGGVLGVATPPFIYGNAPSSAKQPLPLPRFSYRA